MRACRIPSASLFLRCAPRTIPRLWRVCATSGWFRPRACSLMTNARLRSSSASPSLPCSRYTRARLLRVQPRPDGLHPRFSLGSPTRACRIPPPRCSCVAPRDHTQVVEGLRHIRMAWAQGLLPDDQRAFVELFRLPYLPCSRYTRARLLRVRPRPDGLHPGFSLGSPARACRIPPPRCSCAVLEPPFPFG